MAVASKVSAMVILGRRGVMYYVVDFVKLLVPRSLSRRSRLSTWLYQCSKGAVMAALISCCLPDQIKFFLIHFMSCVW